MKTSIMEQIAVAYRLSLLGIEDFNSTNPNFNVYTTRQGTRVIVTRRRGELRIHECVVNGVLTQSRKK